MLKKKSLQEASPPLLAWLSPDSPLPASKIYQDTPGKFPVLCRGCGETRLLRPSSLFDTVGKNLCHKCGWKVVVSKRITPSISEAAPDLAKLFSPSSPVQPESEHRSSRAIAVFICQECGNEHEGAIATVISRKDPSRCKACKYSTVKPLKRVKEGEPSLADSYPQLVPLLASRNELKPSEMASGLNSVVYVDCPDCHDVRAIRLRNAAVDGWTGRCATCASRNRNADAEPLSVTHPLVAERFAASSPLSADAVRAGSSKRALFECQKCSTAYEAIVANQSRAGSKGLCSTCKRER